MSIGTPVTPQWTSTVTSRHSTVLLSTIIPSSTLPSRSSSLLALHSLATSQLVTTRLDSVVSTTASQHPSNHQLTHPLLRSLAAEGDTAKSTRYYLETDRDVRSPRLMNEDTSQGSIVSNCPSALLLNGRSSTGRGMTSSMAIPSPSSLDSRVALRREGSTGSGRALYKQSGWEGASSKPRQPLVSSSLSLTLSLDFETERNGNGEGSESEIVGITLFDKEDIARLSTIIGRHLWNEEGNASFEVSKRMSRTDVRDGTARPEIEPEKVPLPSLKDTFGTEERVKPGLRGSRTTQPATQESRLQLMTEK